MYVHIHIKQILFIINNKLTVITVAKFINKPNNNII